MNRNDDDLRAAHELRRMAELYIQRGANEKAADLLELAGMIEDRVNRQMLQMDGGRDEERTPEAL